MTKGKYSELANLITVVAADDVSAVKVMADLLGMDISDFVSLETYVRNKNKATSSQEFLNEIQSSGKRIGVFIISRDDWRETSIMKIDPWLFFNAGLVVAHNSDVPENQPILVKCRKLHQINQTEFQQDFNNEYNKYLFT